jgi:hypothetical protein
VLLPVASIDASPLNPHKRFVDENLQRLADSLEADRLPQPIVVTPRGRSAAAIGGQAIQVTVDGPDRDTLNELVGQVMQTIEQGPGRGRRQQPKPARGA